MEESVTKMGQHALVFVGKKILHLEDVTFRQKEREREEQEDGGEKD